MSREGGSAQKSSPSRSATSWVDRYSVRHKLVRLTDFPAGLSAPLKVRIYRRQQHFVLQWWDPQAKGNLSDRINGDLLDALARAREIDQRLSEFRTSGHGRRRLTHPDLLGAYLEELHHRADAGEISIATARRYEDALEHYRGYVDDSDVAKSYRFAASADRQFALRFAAFLSNRHIAPNGHANGRKRPMQRPDYILDVVRALFEWASDPHRGNMLPSGFRNPFLKNGVQRRRPVADMMGEPDVTIDMAAEFLTACDDYQLALFAPMVLYGLRATEPAYLFHEFIDDNWITISCIEDLAYTTKGLRNKRLPMVQHLRALLGSYPGRARQGLALLRRSVAEGHEKPPLLGASLQDLIAAYQARCSRDRATRAEDKLVIRDSVLREAGSLTYDLIQGEFRRVAGLRGWPRRATLKDFRHLFSTAMANGGLPEHERRYLMGHAPGKAAIVGYTHLNRLAEHFQHAVDVEMLPILQVLHDRGY